MAKRIIIVFFALALSQATYASKICSRIAIINNQEILIDNNSLKKAEGLRFHLAKDEVAKSFLDRYQEGTTRIWHSAIIGTTGTGLIIGGLMSNSSSDNNSRLILGGVSLLIINYLVSQTLDYTNEFNLQKAVEEYNKRNLPKIYLKNHSNDDNSANASDIYLEKSWSF